MPEITSRFIRALERPSVPRDLYLPPPPEAINRMSIPGVPQPPVPLNEMPAFQGFPGPFPGDFPTPTPDMTPQERVLARLDTLNLPPQVLERLRQTLTGTPPAAPTPTPNPPPTPTTGGSTSRPRPAPTPRPIDPNSVLNDRGH